MRLVCDKIVAKGKKRFCLILFCLILFCLIIFEYLGTTTVNQFLSYARLVSISETTKPLKVVCN